MLHYIEEPGEAPSSEGRRRFVPQAACRTHEFDATLDELERCASMDTGLWRNWREASMHTRQIRQAWRFAAAVEQSSVSQVQHMALETKVIVPAVMHTPDRRGPGGNSAAFATTAIRASR
jgi:hypothetical protein